MPFPPKQDHRITLTAAAALTKAHRAAAKDEVKGEMWPRDVFETLLAQPGSAGIRIYHGRGAKGEKQLVMVSVDGSGADMTSATIMQAGLPCPPWCYASSPLQG